MDNIRNRKKNTLENVKMDSNLITGTIRANQDEVLQISVPYSKGYRVYVDGKKTDCFKSGIAYLGVKINKGDHDIKITYETPFLRLGVIVTVIASLALIAYQFPINKRKKICALTSKNS